MQKDEFVNLLKKLDIPINEGIQNDKNENVYPRIVFWETTWEPQLASNSEFNTIVTYQVSFFSRNPRDIKLLNLKESLSTNEINPIIYHEYIKESNYFHSFFAIDLLEKING